MPLGRAFRLPSDPRPVRYSVHLDLDLDTWTFAGEVRIELRLDRERREIALHSRDLVVPRATARRGEEVVPASLAADETAQLLALRFAQPLAVGGWTLDCRFSGAIRSDLKALYRSRQGEDRYAVAILFPAEARRVFPCFDEPTFKARFAVELTAPRGLAAIGNGRLVETREASDGRSLWRFAETPPLSTYLLTLAVGPFEPTEEVRTRTGLPVRIWLPRGVTASGAYARDAHRAAVEWLEDYTAVPYPYDKVEGVGIPDFPAGAMENPGAITYRVDLLAAEPGRAATAALRGCVEVVSHELAHMWWGDLVTLAWWDDIWLNESFATFAGNKAVDAVHPDWLIWRDFAIGTVRGFALDALASTHAIRADAETADDALQRIDAVTYQKGATILRMLERYLGEDTFRAGVRLYLQRFRERNATAADFWRALDETSGQDVSAIAGAWIGEPGYPIVEFRASGDNEVTLRQRRFFLDPAAPSSPQRWPIPLVVRTPAGDARALLAAEAGSLNLPRGAWLHPNAGGTGFYRFALDDELWRRLLAQVGALAPAERLVLLDNEWALLLTEATSLHRYVALVRALHGQTDRAVLGVLHEQLRWLLVHATPTASAPIVAALAQEAFGPVAQHLGWRRGPSDSDDERELRGLAIQALGEVAGAADVRAEAARCVARHFDGDRADPDLLGAWLFVAALDGAATLHGRYLARLRGGADGDPQELRRLLAALPAFRDPRATTATLAATFDGTIRDQDLPTIFFVGFRNPQARAAYWRAFRSHYSARISRLEGLVRQGALRSLALLTPPGLAGEADAFLAALDEPDDAEIVARTRESLRLGARAAARIAGALSGP